MLIKRLWRYTVGEVRFRAEGGLCERFLTLLAEGAHPILLWDIESRDGVVTASCRTADYQRIRPFARRTGTRVRHIRSVGLAKTCAPLRRHPGLLTGAILATVVYLLLGARMWVVNIDVEDPALHQRIEQELAQCGVGIGHTVRDADVAAIRIHMIAAVPQIHRLSLSFRGCVVDVSVAEDEGAITLPDTAPANVVAARDGLILSTRVLSGDKVVKVGEAVVAGELLVSGAVETKEGLLFRHAEAEILAQTERVLTASVSRQETVTVAVDRRCLPTWRFLTMAVPLYSSGAVKEDWTVTTASERWSLMGMTLPVGVDYTIYTKEEEQTVCYSEEQMERLAKARIETLVNALGEEVQVQTVVYERRFEGETLHITARCTVIEDIAKEQALLIETE